MVSAPSDPPAHAHAYRQRLADLLTSLGTDPRRGLSEADAHTRLQRYGANELTAAPPPRAWQRFLAQFQDALVILLLVATAISAAPCAAFH